MGTLSAPLRETAAAAASRLTRARNKPIFVSHLSFLLLKITEESSIFPSPVGIREDECRLIASGDDRRHLEVIGGRSFLGSQRRGVIDGLKERQLESFTARLP